MGIRNSENTAKLRPIFQKNLRTSIFSENNQVEILDSRQADIIIMI